MNVRQIAVPDLICVLGQFDTFQFAFAVTVENTQLNLAGICREQREIGSFTIPGRTPQMGRTFPDARFLTLAHFHKSSFVVFVKARRVRFQTTPSGDGCEACPMSRDIALRVFGIDRSSFVLPTF
jgi:hypothetical protein